MTGGNARRRAFWTSITLTLFAVPFAAMQYKVPALLPDLIRDFSLEGQSGPWLITMFTLTGAVMTLCAGPLSDKIGLRKSLLVAGLFAVGGSAMGILFHQPIELVASRGVEGIGFAIVCVCGPIAIERSVPKNAQGLANGIWSIWIPVGAFLGEVASPVVYHGPLGFAGLWGIIVVPIILLAALVVKVVPGEDKTVGGGQDSTIGAECVSKNGASGREGDREARNPIFEKDPDGRTKGSGLVSLNFVLFLAAWLSFNLLNFAVMSYGPSYLQGTGMDPTLSGVVTTIPMIMSIATGPIGGAFIDRFGHPKALILFALAANAATTFMLFTTTGAMVWVAVVLMGLFATMTFVATLSSLGLVVRPEASYSSAVSVYMFVQVAGELAAGILSPLLLGPGLSDWGVFALAWGVVGCIGVLAAALTRIRGK